MPWQHTLNTMLCVCFEIFGIFKLGALFVLLASRPPTSRSPLIMTARKLGSSSCLYWAVYCGSAAAGGFWFIDEAGREVEIDRKD